VTVRERALLFQERFVFRSHQLGRGVQRVVVVVMLTLVYVFGMGATRLLAGLFYKQGLCLFAPVSGTSSWIDAEGYEPEPVKLFRQF
jgi:hypothetical protein